MTVKQNKRVDECVSLYLPRGRYQDRIRSARDLLGKEHPASEGGHQREERARGVTDPQCSSKKRLARPLGSPVAKSKLGRVLLRLERARVSPPRSSLLGAEHGRNALRSKGLVNLEGQWLPGQNI